MELEKQSEKVLIIDDDPTILGALETILKRKGYDVISAKNGSEGLEIMRNESIAVIICDQNLPGEKGVEILQKSIDLQPDAIRIGLTGDQNLETLKELVNIGQISQFIPKPWDNTFLLKTIQNSMEKVRLIRENHRLHRALEENHENLKREFKLGGQVQNTMLNGIIPKDIPGLTIDAISLSSKTIDGDFFDFYRPSHECFDVVIADVMGKGLPAALVGTAVKAQLTRFAVPFATSKIYTKKFGWHQEILDPSAIMSFVQNEIVPHLIDLEHFVCLTYGRFNMIKRTFSLVDCGSTKPFHYHAATNTISKIQGFNFPLGMVCKDSYQTVEVPFAKDDLFIFYSDGLTEAMSPAGEIYGEERLIQLVQNISSVGDPFQMVRKLTQELINYTGKEIFDDDLTILIVKIDSEQPLKLLNNRSKFRNDLSQLQAVRDFVDRFCSDIPEADENFVQKLQLTLNEAFTNIVEHGYETDDVGTIIMEADCVEGGIVFHIIDQGKPFDPIEIQDPSFAGDKYRGFGLFMMKQIADILSYKQKKSKNSWNELSITKFFRSNKEPMKFSHEKSNNILTVTLEGTSLDAKEAPQFKQEIFDLIRLSQIQKVVLDLHNLNFIDSSGLGSFLSILRQLNTKGGELKIASMNKSIRTVFELVCMHKIFEIYNSKDEAVKSFK